MPNETQVSIRLPSTAIERATALEAAMKDRPELAPYRVSRASVLREAMLKGLALMEAEYQPKKKRAKPAPKQTKKRRKRTP